MTMMVRRTFLILALVIPFAGSALAQSITLAWDEPEPNLAGYNVYRSYYPGVFTAAPLNGTSLVVTTSFTDSTVQNGQTYYYAVTAVSATGVESVPSEIRSDVGLPNTSGRVE